MNAGTRILTKLRMNGDQPLLHKPIYTSTSFSGGDMLYGCGVMTPSSQIQLSAKGMSEKWPNVIWAERLCGWQRSSWPKQWRLHRSQHNSERPVFLVMLEIFGEPPSWEEWLSSVQETHCQAWPQTMHCRDVICIIMEANQAGTIFPLPLSLFLSAMGTPQGGWWQESLSTPRSTASFQSDSADGHHPLV